MLIPSTGKSSRRPLVENVPIVTPDEAFSLYEGLKVAW